MSSPANSYGNKAERQSIQKYAKMNEERNKVTALKFKPTRTCAMSRDFKAKEFEAKFTTSAKEPFKLKMFAGVESRIEAKARVSLKPKDQNKANN